jgi:lipopolysaccharide transport system permease protein
MSNKPLEENEDWTMVIKPKNGLMELNLTDLWKYKDLVFLFVRRDFVSAYKQTILGPLWFIIQPIITTLTFTVIFNKIAKLPTEGVPPFVFYMSGQVLWNYFSSCLTKTSNTFISNSGLFGKVYFPRLIIPIADLISNMISFGLQFVLFLIFTGIYYFSGAAIHPNLFILLIPILILMMAGMGLGFGIIISSMTTKYRDLTFLVGFGVQLLMYATPVIYPMSLIPNKFVHLWLLGDVSYKTILWFNPVSSIIETFRYAMLGAGSFDLGHLLYSFVFMSIIIFFGIIIFNKVEKNFMDVV